MLPDYSDVDEYWHKPHLTLTSSATTSNFCTQCSTLRKNGRVVIYDRLCRITNVSNTSSEHDQETKRYLHKTKSRGYLLFDPKRKCPQRGSVRVLACQHWRWSPHSRGCGERRKDYVAFPEGELGQRMRADFEVGKELIATAIAAMGEQGVVSYREAPTS